MPFNVYLTDDATQDLEGIFGYIAIHDAPEKAARVLGQIQKAVLGLADVPDRGVHPKELLALGIRDYREIFFKPYRVIYQVIEDSVYVVLISDGRRDMQTLLRRRLLGA